jgi:hypothetical protein
MNKFFLIPAMLICSTVCQSQSAITLGNSNMPSSGDTLRYSSALPNTVSNYTSTGTNFTWNFNYLTPVNQGVRSFKAALLTPYAFFFLGLNEYGEKIADTLGAGPITMTNYYNYYKKQTSPSAYIADGVGITFSSVPVPSYYSDKDELYHFPMTYPKYDSTTFKFSTSTNSMIPIKYSKTGYRVTVVDGWGSITTPYGTANCLRVITTQYSQDSVKNTLIPGLSVGFPNIQRSYQWLTVSGRIPYLEISGAVVGGSFTPAQVRYRDIPRTITGIEEMHMDQGFTMYPNPVSRDLHIGLTQSAQIRIYNITGQLVKEIMVNNPENAMVIDVSTLENGLYTVQVGEGINTRSFKFIKE